MGGLKTNRGDCSKCGAKDCRIAYGYSTRANRLCITCNRDRLALLVAAKPRKEVKRTPITVKPSHGLVAARMRDREVNTAIWASRPHMCVECGAGLPSPPDKIFFSHLHTKNAHPSCRHDPDNIVLHCPDCHREWEGGGRRLDRMPKTQKLFEAYNPNLSK